MIPEIAIAIVIMVLFLETYVLYATLMRTEELYQEVNKLYSRIEYLEQKKTILMSERAPATKLKRRK